MSNLAVRINNKLSWDIRESVGFNFIEFYRVRFGKILDVPLIFGADFRTL